jgi:hypothetical protein
VAICQFDLDPNDKHAAHPLNSAEIRGPHADEAVVFKDAAHCTTLKRLLEQSPPA